MDLKEALTTSINFEQKVHDHYAKGAQEILSPKGKKVFATLAKEEQGHLDYLKSRLAEWHANGKVSSPDLPTLLPSVNWIEEAKARMARGPAGTIAVEGELDLLKIDLDLERRTSGFYQQLVDTMKFEEREMFARFLEIEHGHLAIVQAEIDSLAGNGTWFDVMEFQLEAG
jgi:rubrerythrin